MQVKEGQRKERSDKKKEIKPTIPVELYECVSRLSYITNTPVKDVGVIICKKGLYSAAVMEYLSSYFKRDFWANNNMMFTGDLERTTYTFPKNIAKRRMTMQFPKTDHEQLARLAFSLDLTISSATGLLLDISVNNTDVVNAFISKQVKSELDPKRMKQLREVVKFINQNNPYHQDISFGAFASMLLDEAKGATLSISESFKQWLDRHGNF